MQVNGSKDIKEGSNVYFPFFFSRTTENTTSRLKCDLSSLLSCFHPRHSGTHESLEDIDGANTK